MVVGLTFAGLLVVLGFGAGARQFATRRRVREEPYMPEVDRVYYRGQVRRRLAAAGLLVLIGGLIAFYYLSGMDARMDELGAKRQQGDPPEEDKQFARFVGTYWVAVILLVGLVGLVAVFDFWATRVYWMARYKEMKSDHEAKFRRDMAVHRQQQLNKRMKGLKPPDDETTPEGEPPVA